MKMLWTMVLGLFLLAGCNNSDDTLGNWVKKNAFEGIARGSAVSFVIGDKAYIGLGYNSDDDNEFNDEYLLDFWSYDAPSDRWTRVANFPGKGRTYAVGFSVNGKGYVATGYDGENKLKDVWEYDPTSNSWTQKDDFAGGARYSAVAFSIGNYGYVGTGYGEGSSDKNDFYRYDPTAAKGSQWTKIESIGGDKRRGATAFVYDSKAYVCTGYTNSTSLKDMWCYDPTAPTDNSWTKKIDLDDDDDWTIMRKNASSFVLDNKAYVCLGESSGTLKTVWEYSFAGDTWVQKTDFEGSARTCAIGFTVASKAMIAVGQSGSSAYMEDVWEFKPFDEYDDED